MKIPNYRRITLSFTIGEYEDFKKAALDPYVAMRNACFQHREQKIRNR